MSSVSLSAKSASPPAAKAATSGSSIATCVAGGSITVSERSDPRSRRGCEQRDHAAVRVADEVVARLEQAGDELRVLGEVDAVDRRIRREARTFHHDQLEALGERGLCAPRSPSTDDTAVDEDETLHRRRILVGSRTLPILAL